MFRILIVEDDLMVADILEEALTANDFAVCSTACSVSDAIVAADRFKPDFAIIDLHLANGELGTDVAVHLRGRADHIGIIYSTGNEETAIPGMVGDGVMTKPYHLRDVPTALKIIDELYRYGQTGIPFPKKFELLDTVCMPPACDDATPRRI